MTWGQREPMTEEQIAPFDAILRERRLPWFPTYADHEWVISPDYFALSEPNMRYTLAGYDIRVDESLPPDTIELRRRE